MELRRAQYYGHNQRWRYCLDPGCHCSGHDDDGGAGILLRRYGSTKESSLDHQSEFHHDWLDQPPVDTHWLYPGFWRERRWFIWRVEFPGAFRGWSGTKR